MKLKRKTILTLALQLTLAAPIAMADVPDAYECAIVDYQHSGVKTTSFFYNASEGASVVNFERVKMRVNAIEPGALSIRLSGVGGAAPYSYAIGHGRPTRVDSYLVLGPELTAEGHCTLTH